MLLSPGSVAGQGMVNIGLNNQKPALGDGGGEERNLGAQEMT
jgi:hypothetical protein